MPVLAASFVRTRLLLVLALTACAWSPARAETLNCTNITTLPTTISSQGVYCLKQDLSTAITTGNAITVFTNNVTLDCNGYKLGGLAAGENTLAVGLGAFNRLNVTVRNCNIRGFRRGLMISGGGGHLVEDNRFDGNTYTAVFLDGDGSTIRRNRVYSTGGSTNTSQGQGPTIAIDSRGTVDVLDNSVWGMTPMTGRNDTAGMTVGSNVDGTVGGNRISGLGGTFNSAIRVYASSSRVRVVDNNLSATSWGLSCDAAGGAIQKDNILESGNGLSSNCVDAGGNFLVP